MDLDQRPDPGPNPRCAAQGPRAWEQPHPWAALIQTWSDGTEFPSSPGPVALAGAVQTEGHPWGQFPALQGRRDGDMVGGLILIPVASPQPLACWRGHKMAWQSHPGAAALLAPPACCPPPHRLSDLVGHSRGEGVPCPTITWGFLSPPISQSPKRCWESWAAVTPHKDALWGSGSTGTLNGGQEPMCCWASGPAHATPSKAFIPPLCSWLQTQGTQHPPRESLGLHFVSGHPWGPGQGVPVVRARSPPRSKGDGRQTEGSAASHPGPVF